MNKPLVLVSCPVDTFSGYGARSRDIVKTLINSGKYDVRILSQKWGSCQFGYLKSDNPEHQSIKECILTSPQVERQPDVWIQISIPSEMQKVGKYNILITAGIETTICAPEWIEGCNRADLVLVSSNHAKTIFESTKFEKRDGDKFIGVIELTTECQVLFEGFDETIYKKLDTLPEKSKIKQKLDNIDEKFCFLFTGHYLQGDLGEDRKDVGMLIKTFLETFKNKPIKPALLLKVNGATYSIMDMESMSEKISHLQNLVGDIDKQPNIYLLHGELSDEEMNELNNHPKVKAFVSFTKGEGFGRPLLESSILGKPVIASNWSGHLDFLKKDLGILLPGKLTQIHPSAVVDNMIIPESQWFTVDYKEASKKLYEVYKDYPKFIDNSKKLSYIIRKEFTLEKMGEKLINTLDAKIPQVMPLNLPFIPKLTKIEA